MHLDSAGCITRGLNSVMRFERKGTGVGIPRLSVKVCDPFPKIAFLEEVLSVDWDTEANQKFAVLLDAKGGFVVVGFDSFNMVDLL